MRKIGRVDTNQKELVTQLMKIGATVSILSNVGGGVPDIIVGYKGVNYLFEMFEFLPQRCKLSCLVATVLEFLGWGRKLESQTTLEHVC